ncbi:MAG TPA: SRPBCC family protein [Pyrinomonadaceae bacterium]|nr:SRPBCC family protein [Pyrinomonadaceae bacterium]
MSVYSFVTNWSFDAMLERVWAEIEDADAWPDWWKGVLNVELLKDGDADGIGSIRRTTWKSALPYELTFDSEVVRIEKHELIEVRAFGQLEGRGLWSFSTDNGRTDVRYDWTVVTNKGWMNLLAPIAKPIFRWNHDVIMRWGEQGMRKRLSS